MNFNSLQYILFLPIVLLLYFTLPKKLKNPVLLLASYFFYMCWNPAYALLMLFSTAATYICGLLIQRKAAGRKKLWLVSGLVINLLILFFFKYFNFFTGAFTSALGIFGMEISVPTLDVLLPVGISFYTFQALGYTIDVYRGDASAEKNFIDYALFVSFFPQLVAGPIERFGNIIPQLKTAHKFSSAKFKSGFLLVLWGMMKKMLVADNLSVIVTTVYGDPHSFSGIQLAIATVCFAFQIYCDFSAYSDIARGSARMLGIELMQNFDNPYSSKSIKEFWRRWHISLSTWFKDYIYFPLGGSRVKRPRYFFNLMVVFVISGLWHGAAFTYVLWGFLHGFYQVAGAITLPFRKKVLAKLKISEDNPVRKFIGTVCTFILVDGAWILFRANSVSDAVYIAKSILRIPFGGSFSIGLSALGLSRMTIMITALAVVLILIIERYNREKHFAEIINKSVWLRYAVYFAILIAIVFFGYYGSAFEPQDFVYFQF